MYFRHAVGVGADDIAGSIYHHLRARPFVRERGRAGVAADATTEYAIMTEQPPAGFDRAITDYYERTPEESRLEHGAFRLEEARTRELIERHAPDPPAEALDVGGAAGAYAIWLAERGYAVHLLDATPRLVEEARRRSSRAARGLVSCRVADARALPVADDSFDLVLLLGPLYHLVDAADRQTALREVTRVLRPGGVLLAAGITRFASALDGLSRDLLGDDRFMCIVEQDIRDGQHRNPTERLDYFTTAYFHEPAELRTEVENAGLALERLYGIEGPGWILPDLAERWNDPERRAALLRVARLLEAEPSVLGCSAHLLAVGRKPTSAGPPAA
ncbi:MAG: methyltransferase domain-containing protein [Gemmatimonadaceae bacterium]